MAIENEVELPAIGTSVGDVNHTGIQIVWTGLSGIDGISNGASPHNDTMHVGERSEFLVAEDYGFSGLSNGDAIKGVKVEVLYLDPAPAPPATQSPVNHPQTELRVQLYHQGAPIGSNKATGAVVGLNVAPSNGIHTFGGPSDMWGLSESTLTASLVKSKSFGVVYVSDQVAVPTSNPNPTSSNDIDTIRITIYFQQ